jgi:hypothetical protein
LAWFNELFMVQFLLSSVNCVLLVEALLCLLCKTTVTRMS